jgi:hypothetical protein
MTLPAISWPAIVASLGVIVIDFCLLFWFSDLKLWVVVVGFFISGFIADALTGILHFCFDYVFPHSWPIVGPISKEFNEHHEMPTLDPITYPENLTKGAYASFPASAWFLLLLCVLPEAPWGPVALVAAYLLSIWAFFFHQIHSYAHMGTKHNPEEFLRQMTLISQMRDDTERRKALRSLFSTIDIPPVIRALQNLRLILSPERHNLHHMHFEADFSSVNGWSDPVLNLVLTPVAKRLKLSRT